MIIKGLQEEDFTNYKKASMFIIFPKCSFKCDKENKCKLCQNSNLVRLPDLEVNPETLVNHYINNPITSAIVFGGLEPLDSCEEMLDLIKHFRDKTEDEIIIYTGYTEEEIKDKLVILEKFKNIIVKFGRFRPNSEPHFDELLGVRLMNPEQYAKKIS